MHTSAAAARRLTYPLVLASSVAFRTLEFAKSQLEYMDGRLIRDLEAHRGNPFERGPVRLVGSLEALAKLPAGPKARSCCFLGCGGLGVGGMGDVGRGRAPPLPSPFLPSTLSLSLALLR